jgi:hypothetical protein
MMHNDSTRLNDSFRTAIPVKDGDHIRPHDLASISTHTSRMLVPPETELSREVAIGYILTDCFISLGQGVKDGKTIDQTAVVWLHDRYRAKFLRTMQLFGNTWLRDRLRVKGVSRMLGERAVYYAGDKPTIDLSSVLQASADVEKYCRLHATRRHRSTDPAGGTQPVRHAGYWCEPNPE